MELEDILALIDHVSAAGLQSFRYETEELKLSIKGKAPVVYTSGVAVDAGSVNAAYAGNMAHLGSAGVDGAGAQTVVQTMSGPTAAGPVIQPGGQTVPEGKIVTSPLVGTFYVAPSEGAEPYVQVGDSVKKGQVLAIVEAMKLMNEIECDYDGVVTDILAEDGEPVEYGQPLFCIK